MRAQPTVGGMTAAVIPFPNDVDRLWADYRALALQLRDNPALQDDARFIAHVTRAHRLFDAAYTRWCRS